MSHENSYFETSWNLRFSASEPEPSSVFWFMLPSKLHQVMFAERQAQILLEKCLNVKVLFIKIKVEV
jgi:hypothetical protein